MREREGGRKKGKGKPRIWNERYEEISALGNEGLSSLTKSNHTLGKKKNTQKLD